MRGEIFLLHNKNFNMWHFETRSLSHDLALLALTPQEQPAHKIFSPNYEKVSLNPPKKNIEVFHPALVITAQLSDIVCTVHNKKTRNKVETSKMLKITYMYD